MPKLRAINATKEEDIRLVYTYLTRENKKKHKYRQTESQLQNKAAEILNVSRATVRRVLTLVKQSFWRCKCQNGNTGSKM